MGRHAGWLWIIGALVILTILGFLYPNFGEDSVRDVPLRIILMWATITGAATAVMGSRFRKWVPRSKTRWADGRPVSVGSLCRYSVMMMTSTLTGFGCIFMINVAVNRLDTDFVPGIAAVYDTAVVIAFLAIIFYFGYYKRRHKGPDDPS